MPARPDAINNCAPYGMIPCTRQEKVSSMLAHLRGSRLNFVAMSFAIPPVVMIAIVLLAVHRFAIDTSAAILASAHLLLLIREVIAFMMQSRPPATRIISSIPPASIVTIISSPIPETPVPIYPSQVIQVIFPVAKPIMAFAAIPTLSTIVTFIPTMAIIITRR